MFRKLNLTTKTLIMINALIISASVIIAFLFTAQEKRIVREQFRERGETLANNLAYNSEYGMLTGNTDELIKLVMGVLGQSDVIYCVVKDALGEEVVSRYQTYREDVPVFIKWMKPAGETITSLHTKLFSERGEEYYSISVPIVAGEAALSFGEEFLIQGMMDKDGKTKIIGVASVGISLARANQLILSNQRIAVQIVALLVLIASLVSVFLVRRTIEPIKQLVDAAEAFAKGDLEYRVKIKSRDEIGNLADSFNKMAEELMSSTVSITELRKSETRFDQITNSVGDWVWEANENATITYSSDICEKVIGYRRDELLGRFFYDFLYPETKQIQVRKIVEKINAKEEFKSYPLTFIHKNGDKLTIDCNAIPIFDGEKFVGYRGVYRDVTQREKLKESQRLVSLGQLVSNMGHEVNNPLMIIAGRAQLALASDIEDEEIKKSMKIIYDQCYRAKEIIQRLLTFSKPSTSDMKDYEIGSVIDEVVDLIEHQYGLDNIEIIRNYKTKLPNVRIDKKMIQEAFMNFLSNSKDAMPEGGEIEIKSSLEENFIRLEFRDTGVGIEPENIDKIVDPFFTTKEKGTGLGLSVVYGTVKIHGGDLKYESTPGKGTTAAVLLPIRK